ncbi:Hypothetical protein ETEE_2973 [Edwardsiella anguillarum ET080813]|uniref:Uncharacterized protein n=1 Tax=Edwardsiella anguillarum ET080813 TaxID=667120 RepID=A0A076LRW2_9GAMM|nr:Hypothetical protein ETEE_2973 [Edwardsiella anguillarum ET080813]
MQFALRHINSAVPIFAILNKSYCLYWIYVFRHKVIML